MPATSGVNVGVATDYDGQHRPYGAGFDIGFDERPAEPTAVRVERFEGKSAREEAMQWAAALAVGAALLVGLELRRRAK